MPVKKQDKVLVTCPRCGHQQPEPRTAFSSVCQHCGQHLRVHEILHPPPKAPDRALRQKRITCFECGAELDVPLTAESTMCKRCSRYVDLHDYRITTSISKNFKTKGSFVIEPKGYVFNSETLAGDAVVKGRFLGKLAAQRSLTIYSSADIKGSFTAGQLIVPAANSFRWKDPVKVGGAEIAGELVANLRAEGTVVLRSTGRLFGNVESRNLVVEPGSILVGNVRVGG